MRFHTPRKSWGVCTNCSLQVHPTLYEVGEGVARLSKRASYTDTFKLKVVEDRAAAMEYRVKEKQVRDWKQEKDTLVIVRLILEIT